LPRASTVLAARGLAELGPCGSVTDGPRPVQRQDTRESKARTQGCWGGPTARLLGGRNGRRCRRHPRVEAQCFYTIVVEDVLGRIPDTRDQAYPAQHSQDVVRDVDLPPIEALVGG